MLADEDDEVRIERVARPMTLTMVHKILTNPFYTGKILGNEGQYAPSKSHQALVTDELFAKAQAALRKKRVSVHSYQCKNGFKALQSRFRFVCSHTAWLSEALQIDNSIKTSIEALGLLLPHQPAGP